jgi:hypothetical protein
MTGPLRFVLAVLASPFKSRLRREAENAVLRRQLNIVTSLDVAREVRNLTISQTPS